MDESKKNSKKWAVITGASTGIGRDLAIECFRKRLNVAGVARNAQQLDELKSLAQAAGVEFVGIPLDLIAPEAISKLFAQLQSSGILDSLQLWVNNAGVGLLGPFEQQDLEAVQKMLKLNIDVLVEASHRVIPVLRKNGGGHLLQVASTAAFLPGPLMAAYYASKAFVLHFSFALDVELEGSGVRVSTLCPGPTVTEFQKRAGMDRVNLFKGPAVMDSASVARIALRECLEGKRVILPGFFNQVSAFLPRLFPRIALARVAKALMSSVR